MNKKKVQRFVRWLEAAAPRGRSMREYVDTFGASSPGKLIDDARGEGVDIVIAKRPESRHRIYIKKKS